MLMSMASRVVADFTLAPRSLLLSGGFFTYGLQEVYTEEAYLLRHLDLSVLFSALYFGRRALQARSLYTVGVDIAVAVLSLAFLVVDIPRVLLASALLALLLYALFLARPRRAGVFTVLLPLGTLIIVLSLPQISATFASLFDTDLSYTVRVESSQIAWELFSKYPLFGMGQDSVASTTFQELFGRHFFPSDIGLLGVMFKFGLVGLLVYLFFGGWVCVNLLRRLWSYGGEAPGAEQTLLWALFIICLTIILGSSVQARFLKPEGLAVAAFSLGLLMGRQYGPLDHSCADSMGDSISSTSKSTYPD